jgi:hypothetical protein
VSCDRVFLDLCGIFGVEYTNVSRRLYSGWGWGGGGGGETFRVLHVQCYLWGGGGTPPICVEVCTLYLLYSKVSVQMRNSADSGGGGGGEGLAQKTDRFL